MSEESTTLPVRPTILDGKATAREIREEVTAGCAELQRQYGVVPGLTVVLVGEDAASQIYVRNKEKAARKAGMSSEIVRLPATANEAQVLETVARLKGDATLAVKAAGAAQKAADYIQGRTPFEAAS